MTIKPKHYTSTLSSEAVNESQWIFLEKNSSSNVDDLIPESWENMVIKPAFSAGSYLTKLINRREFVSIQEEFKDHFTTKDFLIQEFQPQINELGETSFIFFNGKFSHAVNKKPIENDFRVQIQYGGKYTLIQPNQDILHQAELVLSKIPEQLLYARVDGIVIDNKLHLMEIELIEPDLYFDLADGARERFVESFLKVLSS